MSKSFDLLTNAILGMGTGTMAGFAALPFCMMYGVHPATWGLCTIMMQILSAAIGAAISWVEMGGEDDEPDDRLDRPRSAEPSVIYNPSSWTGRP